MSALIKLEQVSKSYEGGVQALTNTNLKIEQGEFLAIVGPSGSGKSTLLQLIGTLDQPSTGTIHIDGYNISQLNDNELSALRAQKIGFVFQQFHLTPGISAIDNVAEGMLYQGIKINQRHKRATTALEQVGLGHRLHHRPHELSGGERQRVAIARATTSNPLILLADEPTGNLDSHSGTKIIELLTKLNTTGTTILIITHDEKIAANTPRQITIQDGKIQQ